MDNIIEISNMSLNDLEAISPILASDFDEFWNVDILRSELDSPFSHFLVAKNDDEIVGFAGIKVLMDEADLMNVVVKRSRRNQGIASLLLKSLIDLALSFSVKRLVLEVDDQNLPALSLYKKFGFSVCGMRKNYYNNSSNAILMEKCVNGDGPF